MFIADLQEYKADRWQAVPYFQQVNLKWAVGKSDEAYININLTMSRLADIGLVIKENIQVSALVCFGLTICTAQENRKITSMICLEK